MSVFYFSKTKSIDGREYLGGASTAKPNAVSAAPEMYLCSRPNEIFHNQNQNAVSTAPAFLLQILVWVFPQSK